MKNTTKTTHKTWGDVIDQAKALNELGKEVEKLKPLVRNLVYTMNLYQRTPSIPNGAKMEEARCKLHDTIKEVATTIFEKWDLPPEQVDRALDQFKYM